MVITDASPLHKQALIERWKQLEQQPCIFHLRPQINERFETLKRFVDEVHALFGKGMTKRTAGLRRSLLVNNNRAG